MRTTRECPTTETCELKGCQQPYGPPAAALIPERQPIPLDYQPGKLMRFAMALTDRGAVAVKRGPTPFAAIPAPEPPPMPEPAPLPPAPPPAPEPAPALHSLPVSPLRVLEAPGPVFLVYIGDQLLGMTQRIDKLVPR